MQRTWFRACPMAFIFLHTFPPPYYGKRCYNMVILHELEVFLNIFLLICRTFTFFKETERKKEGAVRYSRSRHSSIGIAADKSRCRKQESGEMMLISISISTEQRAEGSKSRRWHAAPQETKQQCVINRTSVCPFWAFNNCDIPHLKVLNWLIMSLPYIQTYHNIHISMYVF